MKENYRASIESHDQLAVPIISLSYDAPDSADSKRVEIAPELGSNMYKFQAGSTDLLYCEPELLNDRDWTGCFVLWPLPNRVSGKKYEFEGQQVDLTDIKRKRGNEPLIHGLVDDQPFEYEEPYTNESGAHARTSIDITPESPMYRFYPYPSRLSLDYTLNQSGVRIGYTVENLGDRNMPFGFALHPYFPTHGGADRTLVTLPAEHSMEADGDLLPSGKLLPMGSRDYDLRRPTPVSGLELDDVFTGLDRSRTPRIDYPDLGLSVELDSSEDFTHMVLYTIDKDPAAGQETGFICFENQTGSTDIINLHTRALQTGDQELEQAAHLLVLPPGQKHMGHIAYTVRQGQ